MDEERLELATQISFGTDSFGEPHLVINVATPDGYGLTPDMADQLGLKILAASAAARIRGNAIQKKMLEGGMSKAEATRFVDRHMPS